MCGNFETGESSLRVAPDSVGEAPLKNKRACVFDNGEDGKHILSILLLAFLIFYIGLWDGQKSSLLSDQ